MAERTHVAGVAMTPFTTPKHTEPYTVMAGKAAQAALSDAGVSYTDVQQAYVGYVYGDSTCGQAALYGLDQSGIPIVNVNNNCSTGSSGAVLGAAGNRKRYDRMRPGSGVRADAARGSVDGMG